MSDYWQPGDLALCVRGGQLRMGVEPLPVYPEAGEIYVVEGVERCRELWLWLTDAPRNADGSTAWASVRFRKIRPHTPDAEDAETIRLLTGKPVRLPA